MKIIAISAIVALAGYASASTIELHTTAPGFCYNDSLPCGPALWGGVCGTGLRQSPINLSVPAPSGLIPIDKGAYRGTFFRMQNNGHSIAFDFANQGPSTRIFIFPDPLNYGVLRHYKFASGHLHWGTSDYTVGSEHCISGLCAAMELHLVHYRAEYPSMADAVASGDESALTVLGVLIDLNPSAPALNGITNLIDSLPIIRNAEHEPSIWTVIAKPLDFTPWLLQAFHRVLTYKGSLTTPDCNEQVNWMVGVGRAYSNHHDLEAMRSTPLDADGIPLTRNHRPLQKLNGRIVHMADVLP